MTVDVSKREREIVTRVEEGTVDEMPEDLREALFHDHDLCDRAFMSKQETLWIGFGWGMEAGRRDARSVADAVEALSAVLR